MSVVAKQRKAKLQEQFNMECLEHMNSELRK